MLFISHFDSDHINGLSHLLKSFGGSTRAFLPYLHPVRRLLVGVRDALLQGDIPLEHISFLDDPRAWLAARGVERVIFVGGRSAEPPEPPNMEGEPEPDPERRNGPSIAKTPSILIQAQDYPPPDLGACERDTAGGFSYMDHKYPIVVHSGGSSETGWVFQTYVGPDEEREMDVHTLVRGALGDVAFQALVDGRFGCGELLRDSRTRGQLASAYRRALKSQGGLSWLDILLPGSLGKRADRSRMNRSSMSLFSGPYQFESNRLHLCWPGVHLFSGDADGVQRLPHLSIDCAYRSGWLLTGDSTLRDSVVLDRFSRFYSQGPIDYLARTLLFTTPHHGSSGNFGAESLRRLGVPPIAVVPAGQWEYFGHPSKALLELLFDHQVGVVHVGNTRGQGLRHHYLGFD